MSPHSAFTRGRQRIAVLVCAAAGLLLGASARAHDIYSSWIEAKILADQLELTLTLARSSAHDLLPDPRTRPPLTPENFAQHADALRAAAPTLVHVTAGKTVLPLRVTDVKISGDNDATFTLTAPRPKAGPLRFFLRYLEHLVSGHVATVVVSNAAGDDLGWSPVTVEQPVFEVPFPPAPPKK